MALSNGYDFTKIEEIERHICVPQNMHQSALDLQALQTVLHDAGVIYPITDSEWVAPILLMPKKIGIPLEEIRNDAYENARIYKEKTKSLHDRMITIEITSLETNKVLKVNGHRLKPFYEGWTVELTAFAELAEPIYEE
ncbi:hypothetical protein Peur_072199 [Populus x canadensis]